MQNTYVLKKILRTPKKMHIYIFASDSGIATVQAMTPDAAARMYDAAANNMPHLMTRIANCDGYITITEDGAVIERISAN